MIAKKADRPSFLNAAVGRLKSLPEMLSEIKLPSLGGMTAPLLLGLGVILTATFLVILRYLDQPISGGHEVKYSDIITLGDQRAIASATFYGEDSVIVAQTRDGQKIYASYPRSDALTSNLVDALINPPTPTASTAGTTGKPAATTTPATPLQIADVTFDPQPGKAFLRFVDQFLLPLLILACFFSFFFLLITGKASGAGDFLGFSKMRARIKRRRKGTGRAPGEVGFDDVAGVPEAKIELQEVVDYLVNPGAFAEMGARAPKGVLLAGPPGTGKTLLAKAVAGEAGVPFISISGSEFVESLVGVGAARVRDLFRQAHAMAPCIIFIDEIDAAGRQRGVGMGQGNDEREQTLNQLMVEMDGFSVSVGIAVMAATNRPDILDAALLRPGRFDRQVVIDVPDVDGRVGILEVHCRSRALDPDVDLRRTAKETPGFTGAELANIVNEAALIAVRRGARSLSNEDFDEAVDRVIAGPARKSHLLTTEEKEIIAVHEAGHAIVARAVGMRTGVVKLSIVARGRQLGHTTTYLTSDRLVVLRSDLERQLATTFGGLAAEQLVYNEVSTGNAGDLGEATELAKKMAGTYGMTQSLARMQIVKEGAAYLGRDMASMSAMSPDTMEAMDKEMRVFLEQAESRAITICRRNRRLLDAIAQELMERETLTGPDLEVFLAKVKPLAELINGAAATNHAEEA
jgi:cell division protease FtsH